MGDRKLKVYIAWKFPNCFYYGEEIYDNLETAKQQTEKIKSEWPESCIYFMEVNKLRKDTHWGTWYMDNINTPKESENP